MASIIDSYNKVLTPINASSYSGRSGVDQASIYSDPLGQAHQSAAQKEAQIKLDEELALQQAKLLADLQAQVSAPITPSVMAAPAAQESYESVVAPVLPSAPAVDPASVFAPAPAAAAPAPAPVTYEQQLRSDLALAGTSQAATDQAVTASLAAGGYDASTPFNPSTMTLNPDVPLGWSRTTGGGKSYYTAPSGKQIPVAKFDQGVARAAAGKPLPARYASDPGLSAFLQSKGIAPVAAAPRGRRR
jgi:hypothetical protein